MSPVSPDRSPDSDRPDEDVDAEFARIIAGWDDLPSLPDPAQTPRPPLRDYVDPPGPPAPSGPPALSGPPEPGPRDYEPAPEPDEGYEPPEPPPLPRGDLPGILAWAATLLGPMFLVFAALFWRAASPLLLGLAVVAFMGGFVALVMRLPSHRDDDSGDDGAVV